MHPNNNPTEDSPSGSSASLPLLCADLDEAHLGWLSRDATRLFPSPVFAPFFRAPLLAMLSSLEPCSTEEGLGEAETLPLPLGLYLPGDVRPERLINALRMTLSPELPAMQRLDALEVLDRGLAVLAMTEAERLELFEQVHGAVRHELDGPRLQERHILRCARVKKIAWRELVAANAAPWEQRRHGRGDVAPELRTQSEFLQHWLWDEVLGRHMERHGSASNASTQIRDIEEAAALVRIIRMALSLMCMFPVDSIPMAGSVSLPVTGRPLLDLWERVEALALDLPCRPSGPAPLISRYMSQGMHWAEDDWIQIQPVAWIASSAAARAITAGQVQARLNEWPTGNFGAPTASRSSDPEATSPTAANKRPPVSVQVGAERRRAIDKAKQATQNHLDRCAGLFPLVDAESLQEKVTLQVISEPIPEMNSRDDQVFAAAYEALREPLPLAVLEDPSSLPAMVKNLCAEFPWAIDAIEMIATELMAQRRLGAMTLRWSPILLVGPPGTGKTRLARRIAEYLGLPFVPLSLGGNADGKILTGTTRGWSSGDASPLLRVMKDRLCAQPLVLLDEVDKCRGLHASNGPALQPVLLGLLEPESARRWTDVFLQVPCDMSRVLYLGTANSLQGMDAPLLSRFRPVLVPPPERRHYGGIAQGVLADVAKEWGVPIEVMPEVPIDRIAARVHSVRELVHTVRAFVAHDAGHSGPWH